MAQVVTNGAVMACSMGMAPSTLAVLPTKRLMGASMPVATITDIVPFMNIPPFGLCTSILNPIVASATAAALGALTPMPCTPTIVGPWSPGSPTVLAGNIPALTNTSMCNCAYAGVITITSPGQMSVMSG